MAGHDKSSEDLAIELKVFENEEPRFTEELTNKHSLEDVQQSPMVPIEENDDLCINWDKENGCLFRNEECCPDVAKSKNGESLTSAALKKVTEPTSGNEIAPQKQYDSLTSRRARKKSRVEFRIGQIKDDNQKHRRGLDASDINTSKASIAQQSDSSQRQRRSARQSFSGQSRKVSRAPRFSVGANHQPKGLSRPDNTQLQLPLALDENGISHCIQNSENKMFVELDELNMEERKWQETTRWMKYEEHVQSNGFWSRPQIPFIEFEGLLALKDYLHEGLVFLEFTSDGLLDFSHTLATTIRMCNRIKPRYRLKLQQIIYLPALHQGDTGRRLHLKNFYRTIVEKNEAERRTESIRKAFITSDDRVRNLWVKLSQKALMFSKFSAGWNDSDDQDTDEAVMNISLGGNQVKETQPSSKPLLRVKLPAEDHCSVTISQYSDINSDRYPLSASQERLLKALPPDCEGVAIKYAPLDFLNECDSFVVLVRMTHGTQLYDFLEVPIDCKFLFLLCASSHGDRNKDLQVCRAFGSLMTDKVFQHDLLLARSKRDVIIAVDKYVKDSVLFPPGQWDLDYLKPATDEITQLSAQRHVIRNQTIRNVPRKRKKNCVVKEPIVSRVESANQQPSGMVTSALPVRRDTVVLSDDILSFLEGYTGGESSSSVVYSPLLAKHPLHTDGRWFGGLRREMTRRYPLYWSDIKDALHIQCLAAFFFVSFAVLALAVTFGKLLVKYTDGYIGDSEMLVATSFSCMLMALVGTEPHTVISGTAAMVVIETVIYKAADLVDIHYLTWRFWIGSWIAIILLLILAFEKTYWITYCTRFTEEILHSLIAILFILEAFKDIYKVFQQHPLHDGYNIISHIAHNETTNTNKSSSSDEGYYGRPNTALLHTLILFSTFGIAVGLRLFQETRYFTPPIRRLLNFFSMPLAVIIMFLVWKLLDVYLSIVEIKHGIKLTSPHKRNWLINPNLSGKGTLGWGMSVLAILPAFFVVIVIFIETEITALMCYKETISRKGTGFHGNLLVVAICVFTSSLFGLPWMCLASVETSNHIDSLRVWSSYNIPGIKSHVEKLRQQRVTLFFIGLNTGLFLLVPSTFYIPNAVLSGLTLYMGVVATFGVQFFKRVELIFMAPSQHPYIEYLTNVPLLKVHLFTVIQIIMIALLMVIKSVESISFIFPIFIILMIPTRVLLGKYVFTSEEMDQLDNEEEDENH